MESYGYHFLMLESLYPHKDFGSRYAARIGLTPAIVEDFLLLSDADAANVARALIVKSKLDDCNGYEELPLKINLIRKTNGPST